MTTTVDVMIGTDETIDEMTGETIDTSERDLSGKLLHPLNDVKLMIAPLVVNDEPGYLPLTKTEDPLIGIKMSLYPKVMLHQDTRY